jgi:hypothetical protein
LRSTLQQLIILRQERVLERDPVLAVRLRKHAEVDGVLEHVVLVFVIEHNLIIPHASTRGELGIGLSGVLNVETSEQVSVTTLGLKLNLELFEIGHDVLIISSVRVQFIEEIIALFQLVGVNLFDFDITWILKSGGNAEADSLPVGMLVLHGKDIGASGDITVGAVSRVMLELVNAHIGCLLNGGTSVLRSRKRAEAILVVIELVDEAVSGANLVEDLVGQLIGFKSLILKIDGQITLSNHADVSVDRGEPIVGADGLCADLTINDVEVLAHFILLSSNLSTERSVGIEADLVGAGCGTPLGSLGISKDNTSRGTLSRSQHDVAAIRTSWRDPRNDIHISLTVKAIDVNAHILKGLQNEVREALLLERIDHDSLGQSRGEYIIFGSGN